MHVDGDATVPFFVAPALALYPTDRGEPPQRREHYVLVNGQLGGVPAPRRSTRFHSVAKRFGNDDTSGENEHRVDVGICAEVRHELQVLVDSG